jgi:PST family polysaccharide transporter
LRRSLSELELQNLVELPLQTRRWGYLLKEAWPLAVATIAATAFQQAPLLALSHFSLDSAGIYSAAARIPQQLILGGLIIRATTFPVLAAAWPTDRDRFATLVRSIVGVGFLISVPLFIFSWGAARQIISLVFGRSFEPAVVPFILLMGGVALMTPGLLVGEALIATGMQRLNLLLQLISTVVLVGMIYLLVPSNGSVGAAVATATATAVLVMATFAMSWGRLGRFRPSRELAPAALALLAGIVIVTSFPSSLVTAVAGSAVALAILVLANRQAVLWLLPVGRHQ